ncbi:ATP-grasp domain-containing protein [Rhizobacter fulvus]
MSVLAVAAMSARLLAEAAALDGHRVVALDLFGDLDTRRASQRWFQIGAASGLRLDGARVLDVLGELASGVAGDAVLGWVPGSGLEGLPDVLEAGAKLLPLIGTSPAAVRRVRDPRAFFDMLDAHAIGHPPVSFEPPADRTGWLLKDARGSGGWHIRAAASDDAVRLDGPRYFQREMAGVPMSATFLADGAEAVLLGLNEMIVRPSGARPHVYAGCIGPVTVPAALAREIQAAVHLLTRSFGLRGWCSLDFMRGEDDALGVLEVNPRPPASLALYAQRGLFDAHVRACLHAELPRADAFSRQGVAGTEIVYARRPLTLSSHAAQGLAHRADAHDLPAAGAVFSSGDPVCSLSASGHGAAQVRALLAAACDDLLETLETSR